MKKEKREKEQETSKTPQHRLSHFINLRKHRTEDIVYIDGVIVAEDGHAPINIRLTLTEDDLHRLLSLACKQASDIGEQFSLMLTAAILRMKTGVTKKMKDRELTSFWLKEEAGCLYVFFSYWCKKKIQDWPKYLRKLLDIANSEGYGPGLINSKGRYEARALTEYCLEKYYGSCFLKDFDNLYITYILPHLKQWKELFRLSNCYEKHDIIVNTPLGPIFKSLKII